MRSGIYAIIHRESGRWYVGQSQNLDKRWSDHVWRLKNNRHGNPLLQRAWNKYGSEGVRF
jgi:predicted GIY-YIG superfamily endonuclease